MNDSAISGQPGTVIATGLTVLSARCGYVEFGPQAVRDGYIDYAVTWSDKYAEAERLRMDLSAAYAEIVRLGGIIPEPTGPLRFDNPPSAHLAD